MAKIHATSRLGDYFVAFRLATREQLTKVSKGQSATQLLGQALVQAGVCDRVVCEKVAFIQKQIRKTAPKLKEQGVTAVLDEKSFIGDILVAIGYITPAQKQEWLDYQDQKRARGENPGRLGELLVDKNVCTAEQRDLGMQVQNWLRGVN